MKQRMLLEEQIAQNQEKKRRQQREAELQKEEEWRHYQVYVREEQQRLERQEQKLADEVLGYPAITRQAAVLVRDQDIADRLYACYARCTARWCTHWLTPAGVAAVVAGTTTLWS